MNRNKKLAVSIFLALLLAASTTLPTIYADTCECEAPDHSCSCFINCGAHRPCFCACLSGGNCTECCPPDCPFGPAAIALMKPVSLDLQGKDAGGLSRELSRISGLEVTFGSTDPNFLLSMDFKKVPLRSVLSFLSKHGDVRIGGLSFSKMENARKAFIETESKGVTLCISGMRLGDIVPLLSYLSGRQISFDTVAADNVVTFSGKKVRLDDVLKSIETQSNGQLTLHY